MVKILSIETSGKVCSVALLSDNELLASYSLYYGNKHDKFCAEFVRRILSDNDLDLSDLSAIAISIGPGSFTGLRIGSAVAKGLSFDDVPPLIAVPTLPALANHFSKYLSKMQVTQDIIAIVPSHSDIVYFQKFTNSGEPLSEPSLSSLEDLRSEILLHNFVVVSSTDLSSFFSDVLYFEETLDAEIIGKYAFTLYSENKFTLSSDLTPMYVQDFVPKV